MKAVAKSYTLSACLKNDVTHMQSETKTRLLYPFGESGNSTPVVEQEMPQ